MRAVHARLVSQVLCGATCLYNRIQFPYKHAPLHQKYLYLSTVVCVQFEVRLVGSDDEGAWRRRQGESSSQTHTMHGVS